MYTRKEYIDEYSNSEEGYQLHRKYYAQFVNEDTIRILAPLRDKILAAKEENFSDTLPLKEWDRLPTPPLAHKMKEAGDFLTASGKVCIYKEAAQQMKEKEGKK